MEDLRRSTDHGTAVKSSVEFRPVNVRNGRVNGFDEDFQDSPRRKHKKKKRKRRESRENLTGHTPAEEDLEMAFALKAMQDQEQEMKPSEKDPRKLAIHLALNRSKEGSRQKFLHFDFVLVHKPGENNNVHEKLRERFESHLTDQGFRIERKYTTERTFLILHCSFDRLCEEAELVCLEMPLAGVRRSICSNTFSCYEDIESQIL